VVAATSVPYVGIPRPPGTTGSATCCTNTGTTKGATSVRSARGVFAVSTTSTSIWRPRKQSCQVAEIPAIKLKRGRRKKKLAERICGRILAEFYQKVAEKGLQKIFRRSSLFLAMITTYNVHQDEIKFDF
jgi:hypothetical protein